MGHGKSDENAIWNALRIAREAVIRKLNDSIIAVCQEKKAVSSDLLKNNK